MRNTMSVRLGDDQVRRLREAATRMGEPPTALAARLVEEGVRMIDHPLITFRPTSAGGRIAGVVNGPDVVEVVAVIRGLDNTGDAAIADASEWLGLHPSCVAAAIGYAADFPEEVEAEIDLRTKVAADARARYDRQQTLLR